MSRPPVFTRPATHDDLETLLTLWDELRQVGARAERAVNPLTVTDIRARLIDVLTDQNYRVVLACSGSDAAGMAVVWVSRPDPLSEAQVVYLSHVVVARQMRQHGVGHALLSAAADFATERHVDHVTVTVYPSLREASRFYARLGFAPVLLYRVAPVGVLRRRLGADRRYALGDAIGDAVRRRARVLRPVPPQRRRPDDAAERISS